LATEILSFTIPANAQTGQPAIAVNITLTISNKQNADGSYTVTAATGTYGTLKITGLAPVNTDGSDNKLFLNGSNLVDFGGITFVTNGTPGGAGTASSADVNFFYTGTSLSPNNSYAIDTATPTVVPTSGISVYCFCEGTRIRTPDGETPVERLKRGDLVVTADGRVRPVTWIGVQTVSTIFSDRVRTWPIRIKAGALDENVPSRDLLLSPDHALLVDGVLIHAGALVNGTSILRETNVPGVLVYYHVELDDHSLILAENTAAETFVDNVNRLAFDNWAEHKALYPNGRSVDEMPYPRAKSRRQAPPHIQAALDRRARMIGAEPAAVA
jgi:hypothetical protein